MGSKSSSSSTSKTEQVDRRIAAESSLVATDGAAIDIEIQDVAPEALEALTEFGGRVLTFAETAQKEAARVSEASLERAFDSTPGGGQDVVRTLIKAGAAAGVGIVAARFAPDIVRAFR